MHQLLGGTGQAIHRFDFGRWIGRSFWLGWYAQLALEALRLSFCTALTGRSVAHADGFVAGVAIVQKS